ncbi:MAG: hypothetical protein WC492_02605 [Candidatus Micrarchaeia archaeon]
MKYLPFLAIPIMLVIGIASLMWVAGNFQPTAEPLTGAYMGMPAQNENTEITQPIQTGEKKLAPATIAQEQNPAQEQVAPAQVQNVPEQKPAEQKTVVQKPRSPDFIGGGSGSSSGGVSSPAPSAPAPAPIQISAPATISQAGTYYLSGDITPPSTSDTAITINAPNVVLEGNGHEVFGTIEVNGEGAIVRNVLIDPDVGFKIQVPGTYLENITAENITDVGIWLTPYAKRTTIVGVSAQLVTSYAVGILDEGINNSIDCAGLRIYGDGTTEAGYGVNLLGRNTTLKNCIIENVAYGVHIAPESYENTIANNSINSTNSIVGYGAYVEGNANIFRYNNITSTDGSGEDDMPSLNVSGNDNEFYYNRFISNGTIVHNWGTNNKFYLEHGTRTDGSKIYRGNYYYNIMDLDIFDSDADGYGDWGSDYPYDEYSAIDGWKGEGDDKGPITTKAGTPWFNTTVGLEYHLNDGAWTATDGSFETQFEMLLDQRETGYYYIRFADITDTTSPLSDGYYGFRLTGKDNEPAFTQYWNAQGVNEDAAAGTWQEEMYRIISGDSPMFFAHEYPNKTIALLDGFTRNYHGTDAALRVNPDYPVGNYTFSGKVRWAQNGRESDNIDVRMRFNGIEPVFTDLALENTSDNSTYSDVSGNLAEGFNLTLNPLQDWYYLRTKIGSDTNVQLRDEYYGFYLITPPDAAGFDEYWNAKGVNAGATTDWKAVMYQIVSGTSPMFYIHENSTGGIELVDGLMHTLGQNIPMRINGDYPIGNYTFGGMLIAKDGQASAPIEVKMMLSGVKPRIDEVELVYATDEAATPSTVVSGDIGSGYALDIDPNTEYYYLNISSMGTNIPLKQGSYGFYVRNHATNFFTYWNDEMGVNASPIDDGWRVQMWEIINGRQPTFYLYIDSQNRTSLVDALRRDIGHGDHLLRLDGIYPPGTYTYKANVTGINGQNSDEVEIRLDLTSQTPEFSVMELEYNTTLDPTMRAVDGSLPNYRLELDDTASTYFNLNVSSAVANIPIKKGYYPFFLEEQTAGTAFWNYWAAKGITESSGHVLWDIINGEEPIFYLYLDSQGRYSLIDGYQKLNGVEKLLRVDGDYPPGTYTFSGSVKGANEETGTVEVNMAFDNPQINYCRVLSTPGETYTMIGNFTATGDCIIITADGVTVNGNGHTILGDGTGTGVTVRANNANLADMTLQHFQIGMDSDVNAEGLRVRNVIVK